SSRRRHTRFSRDWSSDVCSSDLDHVVVGQDVAVFGDEKARPDPTRHGAFPGLLRLAAPRHARHARRVEIRPEEPAEQLVGIGPRSEERRVGKEWRSRWTPEAKG